MEEKHQSTVIRDVIAIVILGIIALIVQFPTPHRTTVIEGDITLSYPVGNTVPTLPWLVLFYAVPFVILLIIYFAREKKMNWTIYNFLVMYIISIIMTEAVCGGLKNVTGRPRPCFFELCGYPSSVENGTRIFGTIGVVADISKCTNKEKLNDAFKSYPSGHAAHSACAAAIAYLLILRLLSNIPGLKKSVKRGVIVFVGLICVCLPLYVGSSRIWDYKHRGDDVLAGYAVGVLSTLVTYYLIYGASLKEDKKKKEEDRSV